jgi:ketosteroid isomerase-like protein
MEVAPAATLLASALFQICGDGPVVAGTIDQGGGDMRQYIWFLGVVGVLVASCAPSVNVEQQRKALIEMDRAWSQTTKDVEKFLTYWAPDASVYPQGMPIATGSGAIRKTITEIFSMPGYSVRWVPTNADVSASGDLGYTSGTYEMTVNDAAGTPMTEKGKYVTVWKKQRDGKWKVMEDIFNADETPPPPPAARMQK